MPIPPPANRIIETVIYCGDLDAARDFYGRILGLREFSRSESHIFYAVGDTVLLVFDPAQSLTQSQLPPHGAPGNGHFAIQIDPEHYTSWVEHLRESGVAIEKEHVWEDSGARSVYFRDPGNNAVELVTRPMWEKYFTP